jgi:Protein of unknown function (DUF1161)
MKVRSFIWVAPLIFAAIPVAALARDCNEVKAEIDAKIKANGAMNYALQIVNGPDVKEGQIVGNCDIGAKKIVYYKAPHTEKLPGAAVPGQPEVIRTYRKMPPQEPQFGNPSASTIVATEKARKNKVAEQSASDSPEGESTAGLDFANTADALLSRSCVVGNWTGTPRC